MPSFLMSRHHQGHSRARGGTAFAMALSGFPCGPAASLVAASEEGQPTPIGGRSIGGSHPVRLRLEFLPLGPVAIRLQACFLHRDVGEYYFPLNLIHWFLHEPVPNADR